MAPAVRRRLSVEGSSPPRPPICRNTWRQRAGEGSRAPPLASSLAALTLHVPAELEESDQKQQEQQRRGPQRPGAPSGQHGCRPGRSGRGATPGCGLHRCPCESGREGVGSALDDGARRPPGPPSRSESPLTCFSGSGTPTFLFQKPAGVQGKGVEAQASPVQSRSQPRPQPGFRFHLRSAEPKGAGRPRGAWPHPLPRLPTPPPPTSPGGTRGTPRDGWREREQPPRKAQSPPPALSPSPSSQLGGPISSP